MLTFLKRLKCWRVQTYAIAADFMLLGCPVPFGNRHHSTQQIARRKKPVALIN